MNGKDIRSKAMNSFDEIQVEELFGEVQVATSGCCNQFLDDTQIEYEVCPCCGDHCEVILDYMPVRL